MKILILCPYPPQEAPSQRFRFEQYLDFLAQKGFFYKQVGFLDLKTWKILYKKGFTLQKIWGILKAFLKRFLLLFELYQYDFIFVHREATPLGFPFVEWTAYFVFKKKIIFDFDDAIWLPNTSQENKIVAWLKFHQKTAMICRWAYKISVGNAFLGKYASKYNLNIIQNPTTIDTKKVHNILKSHTQKKVIIGWTGSHSTMMYLDILLPVFEELSKKYSYELLIISNQAPNFVLPELRFCLWNKASEIADLAQIDIGIMPLVADQWAEGKCGFKALQYMALGIPALVSPVGVNTKIVDEGINGFLCENTEEWAKKLSILIENHELRQKMGRAAHQKVIDFYSVESNKNNFLNLFS